MKITDAELFEVPPRWRLLRGETSREQAGTDSGWQKPHWHHGDGIVAEWYR